MKIVDTITQRKNRTDLLPVIRRQEDFDLYSAKKVVKEYISDLMVISIDEREFLHRFENGEYIPELLFEEPDILARIKKHPMALWKTK